MSPKCHLRVTLKVLLTSLATAVPGRKDTYRYMVSLDKQNIGGETGTSLLAREIASEIVRLIEWSGLERRQADPQRLCDVQPALLNIEQAAKYMGRSVKGIRDLERKGVLVPIRLDRKVQFRRSDLDDVIDRSRW